MMFLPVAIELSPPLIYEPGVQRCRTRTPVELRDIAVGVTVVFARPLGMISSYEGYPPRNRREKNNKKTNDFGIDHTKLRPRGGVGWEIDVSEVINAAPTSYMQYF